MSTRASIIVVTPDNRAHLFYHHHDGYLSGVGEELRRFLNKSANHDDLIKKLGAPCGLFSGCYKDEGLHTMDEFGKRHGDIEFLYIIKNKKLYYMEIWESKDYEKLETCGELVDYICINKHEIDLTKEVTEDGYIYTDNTPEDNTTKKTEGKTMYYTEEKTRIENEIKELTLRLENLKRQERAEAMYNKIKNDPRAFLDFVIVKSPELVAEFLRSEPEEPAPAANPDPAKPKEKKPEEPAPAANPDPAKPKEKKPEEPAPAANPDPAKPAKVTISLDELIDSMK